MHQSKLLVALLAGLAISAYAAKAPREADPTKMPPADATMPNRWLPVDDQGWTVIRPAADSQLLYVSSSEGDDQAAQAYKPADPTIGADPMRPAGAVRPFKTITAAAEKARDNAPDWILLKRGDTWQDVTIRARGGRSKAEPSVICAYGPGAVRPVLRGRMARVNFGSPKAGIKNAVMMGVEMYCSYLDPKASDYGSNDAQSEGKVSAGGEVTSGPAAGAQNILIEDCLYRFGSFHTGGASVMRDVVFRRNLVLDMYPPKGHNQGMWGSHASILVEECIFDHNGWLLQQSEANAGKPGRANMLSHNTYCTAMYSTIFRGNIFLRAASIGNKWTANYGVGSVKDVLMDDNLYVDGEIGISMGGNVSGPLRWINSRAINNVMLDIGRSQPTGRVLGWGLDAADWDGGEIAGNLFLHQANEAVRNVRGLRIGCGEECTGDDVHMRKVSVRGNVFHGLRNARAAIIIGGSARCEDVTFAGNQFQFTGLPSPLIVADGIGRGIQFRDNVYDTAAEPGAWFKLGDAPASFDDWVAKTGEQGARREKIAFPDSSRCIETYMKTLGKDASIDAFIAEVRQQSRGNWRPELSAATINQWIREGFGVKKVGVAE